MVVFLPAGRRQSRLLRPGDCMTGYDDVRQLPLSEMSAAQLARYHRMLVSSLRRCREEQPWYREMRACLAEVLAEERARRLAGRASANTLLVPRKDATSTSARTAASSTSAINTPE